MNLNLILKQTYCKYCNQSREDCRCPKHEEKGVISSIVEKELSKKKKSTVVSGKVAYPDYALIKQTLGTGGTYAEDCCIFRGELKKRITGLLLRQGYVLV